MSTYRVKKFLGFTSGEVRPPVFLELAYERGFRPSAIFDLCTYNTKDTHTQTHAHTLTCETDKSVVPLAGIAGYGNVGDISLQQGIDYNG